MDSLQSATTSFTSISSPSFRDSEVAMLHSQHEDFSNQARKMKFLKIKFMTVEGESPRSSFVRPSNPILTSFYCLVTSQTNPHCRFNQFSKSFQGFTILDFVLINPRTRNSEFREPQLQHSKAAFISPPKKIPRQCDLRCIAFYICCLRTGKIFFRRETPRQGF
jgi:hypothetical protein